MFRVSSKRAIVPVVVVDEPKDTASNVEETKDAGPLDSIYEKCLKFITATFPSFPKLVPLFKAIQNRFPNKKFPPERRTKAGSFP